MEVLLLLAFTPISVRTVLDSLHVPFQGRFMVEPAIGNVNTLKALEASPSGMLFDGGPFGPILLPASQVPKGLAVGDALDVFLFTDSEDTLIATTARPLAMVNQFARLRVVATTRIGAFLDWGLPKDLLLPFREQTTHLREGDHPLVHIRLDTITHRLVASMKVDKHLTTTAPTSLREGTEVSLLIAKRTDLGTNAIVNDRYWGLLHASTPNVPKLGARCVGYIGRIREDGLIDLTLQPPGYKRITGAAEMLASALGKEADGFLPLHDKSPPEEIQARLGMSKKVFKQALGALYRERLIDIRPDGIAWIHNTSEQSSASE